MNRLGRIAAIPLTAEAREATKEYYERFLEDLLFSAKQLADFKRQEEVLRQEVDAAHNLLRVPRERRVLGKVLLGLGSVFLGIGGTLLSTEAFSGRPMRPAVVIVSSVLLVAGGVSMYAGATSDR